MYSSQSPYESLVDLAVSSAMTNCKSMTTEQLSAMLDDDALLDSFIDSLPQIRSMPTDKESALASNKSLAEWNLAQQPRIEQAKAQTLTLLDQAQKLKTEVTALKEQLDNVSSSKTLDVTSNLMQVAAQEADDDAEAIMKQFQDGEIPADLFLKQFKEKKTLAHLRKIKSDRLVALLREQQYGTINQPSRAMPVPAPTPAYPTNNMMPTFTGSNFGSGYSNYPGFGNPPQSKHPFF
ncbi:unnamed protein product [Caenorhabditis bovis]|uniref:VPS37 C-terminal domain-containing protein n=1 Tax=Caenorhabditis bovis TaxID=2654633 RepID=A0A8S1E5I3_9PELO|nr:unnamed protein product [Caenorhabditis bovis]